MKSSGAFPLDIFILWSFVPGRYTAYVFVLSMKLGKYRGPANQLLLRPQISGPSLFRPLAPSPSACMYMCLSLPKALEPPSRVCCASEQDLEPTSTRRLTRVLHASTSFSCYSITNRALVRTPRGRIYHFFHFACLEADGHNVYFINHLWARSFCSLW